MTRLNPHIISGPLAGDSAEALAHRLDANSASAFVACIEQIRSSHRAARELLMAVPRVAAAFPEGVPLAYALYPQLAPMPVDELGAEKFGGLPDLRQVFWMRFAEHQHKATPAVPLSEIRWKQLVQNWPRCGCCHQSMTFVGQLDLTDWTNAIHALTADRSESRTESWLSGLGSTRYLGNGPHRMWWYLFICRDNHFDCPNSDAHVWREYRSAPRTSTLAFLSEEAQALFERLEKNAEPERLGLSEDELKAMLGQFYGAVSRFTLVADESEAGAANSSAPRLLFEHSHKHDLEAHCSDSGIVIAPQRVVGYELGWQFDRGLCPGMDGWELNDAIDEVIDAHGDVFGKPGPFRLFGAPRSQQEARRYWTSLGHFGRGEALRMSPLLSFNSTDADVTCQIYADMHGDSLYCKTDMSNT